MNWDGVMYEVADLQISITLLAVYTTMLANMQIHTLLKDGEVCCQRVAGYFLSVNL